MIRPSKTKTVDVTQRVSEARAALRKDLEEENLFLPRRPKYEFPRLPLEITSLPDSDLMRLFIAFTRFQDHLAGLVARAEIDEHAIETELDIARARCISSGWGGSSASRVAVSKAEASLDPDVRKYDDLLSRYRARRKALTITLDSLARGANVVSREISRRIGRDSNERRADRHTA